CFVPLYKSITVSTPSKVFVSVPKGNMRKKLQEDIENYMKVQLDPDASMRLRKGVLPVGIVRQSFVPEIGPEKGGLRFHVAPKFTVGILLFLWPIFTLFPCKFNFIYLDNDTCNF
ncbi:hypothetical protein ALC57_12156, partial [Trachymyrmex cornetzi]